MHSKLHAAVSLRLLALTGFVALAAIAGALLIPGGSTSAGTGPIVTISTDPPVDTCAVNGCSLREAIIEVQANETIRFNIPGNGPHYIRPTTTLPALGSQNMTVDGFSEPLSDANTAPSWSPTNADIRIVLDGALVPANSQDGAFGFWVGASGITIRGLSIINFADEAIKTGTFPTSLTVEGNYIGLRPDGSTVAGNRVGVDIRSSQSGNVVGGTAAGDRNVISGNDDEGVHLWGGSPVLVKGNFIGTNAAGTAARPNGAQGIHIAGPNGTTIGDSAGGGNLVSGNDGDGIYVASTNQVTISGNRTGTNAAGTGAVPNGGHGIHLAGSSTSTVGGNSALGANLASGNAGSGVALTLETIQTNVKGNVIGAALDRKSPLANQVHGVFLDSLSRDNTIGGEFNANEQNVIVHNAVGGVVLTASAGINNYIDPSQTFSNGGLGTDLLADAQVLPNDYGDGGTDCNPGDPGLDCDSGPNALMNYPEWTEATYENGVLHVEGTLRTRPNDFYNVFVFLNDSCDSSGYGEGQLFLTGSIQMFSDADGVHSFSKDYNVAAIGNHRFITGSASDPESTSEFSQCRAIDFPDGVPTLTPTPTASPTPTPTPTPGPTQEPTDTVPPVGTFASSVTPTVSVTGTAPPTPTVTPTPTPTPSGSPVTPTGSPGSETPTPTPDPDAPPNGDADCNGHADELDALAILAFVGDIDGLPKPAGAGECSPLGGGLPGDSGADADCDGDVTVMDALRILLALEGSDLSGIPGGCPPVVTGALLTVLMEDNVYLTDEFTVDAGEYVQLTAVNEGFELHNVRLAGDDLQYDTGDDVVTEPEAFGRHEAGELAWQAPNAATEMPFRCDFHPDEMTGVITVQ